MSWCYQRVHSAFRVTGAPQYGGPQYGGGYPAEQPPAYQAAPQQPGPPQHHDTPPPAYFERGPAPQGPEHVPPRQEYAAASAYDPAGGQPGAVQDFVPGIFLVLSSLTPLTLQSAVLLDLRKALLVIQVEAHRTAMISKARCVA
jgi:hypothetical protein